MKSKSPLGSAGVMGDSKPSVEEGLAKLKWVASPVLLKNGSEVLFGRNEREVFVVSAMEVACEPLAPLTVLSSQNQSLVNIICVGVEACELPLARTGKLPRPAWYSGILSQRATPPVVIEGRSLVLRGGSGGRCGKGGLSKCLVTRVAIASRALEFASNQRLGCFYVVSIRVCVLVSGHHLTFVARIIWHGAIVVALAVEIGLCPRTSIVESRSHIHHGLSGRRQNGEWASCCSAAAYHEHAPSEHRDLVARDFVLGSVWTRSSSQSAVEVFSCIVEPALNASSSVAGVRWYSRSRNARCRGSFQPEYALDDLSQSSRRWSARCREAGTVYGEAVGGGRDGAVVMGW